MTGGNKVNVTHQESQLNVVVDVDLKAELDLTGDVAEKKLTSPQRLNSSVALLRLIKTSAY